MNAKKVFLLPVIISLMGHAALIGASSMVDLRDRERTGQPFTVQITPSSPADPEREEASTGEILPKDDGDAKPVPAGEREDTVNIGSADIKYAAYLSGVKKKIMRIWKYPEAAYRKDEEGVVVVKMSIEANGRLSQLALMTSSGFIHLDSGTLEVVRAAAPFQPLPKQYDLSRLHIIASFNYRVEP
ncbi:MAG TPA: energy transducer TonB [Smithellaceae bacterium]|nr:energy transducer TonB [Smithellaceae bacterium]HRV45098.1 energy transducer TonB [Smithellaceae bacterium]